MKTPIEAFSQFHPRPCGGWIGIFDDGSLRFGVTADTESATRVELDAALVRWRMGDAENAGDWVREV